MVSYNPEIEELRHKLLDIIVNPEIPVEEFRNTIDRHFRGNLARIAKGFNKLAQGKTPDSSNLFATLASKVKNEGIPFVTQLSETLSEIDNVGRKYATLLSDLTNPGIYDEDSISNLRFYYENGTFPRGGKRNYNYYCHPLTKEQRQQASQRLEAILASVFEWQYPVAAQIHRTGELRQHRPGSGYCGGTGSGPGPR